MQEAEKITRIVRDTVFAVRNEFVLAVVCVRDPEKIKEDTGDGCCSQVEEVGWVDDDRLDGVWLSEQESERWGARQGKKEQPKGYDTPTTSTQVLHVVGKRCMSC